MQEDWDRDMANMKKLGFNTIRAWLVWSTVEPGEGQIKELRKPRLEVVYDYDKRKLD